MSLSLEGELQAVALRIAGVTSLVNSKCTTYEYHIVEELIARLATFNQPSQSERDVSEAVRL